MEPRSELTEQEPRTQENPDVARPAPSVDNIPQLLERWQQESRQQRLPYMILGSLMMTVGGGTLLFGFQMGSLFSMLVTPGLLMMFCAALCIKGTGFVFPLTKAQQQIIADIEAMDDITAAPLLAALAQSHQLRGVIPLRESVIIALTRLLSHMSAEDTVIEFRHNTGQLVNLMTNDMAAGHPDLVIAILRLPPSIVGVVAAARFIINDAPTHHEQRVREVAQEVLPGLLASHDFGSPAALADWIQRLPTFIDEQRGVPAGMILPHLALMKLIPETSADAFLALSQNMRRRLYANLRQVRLPRLWQYQLVVLDMIRRSADVEALSIVQALTDGMFVSPYPQVRDAARTCAAVLKEQLEKEKVSKTLLRGAAEPEVAPDTLLRPASAGATSEPQLLLRANVKENTAESIADTDRPEYAVRPTPVGELEPDATLRLHNGQR